MSRAFEIIAYNAIPASLFGSSYIIESMLHEKQTQSQLTMMISDEKYFYGLNIDSCDDCVAVGWKMVWVTQICAIRINLVAAQ